MMLKAVMVIVPALELKQKSRRPYKLMEEGRGGGRREELVEEEDMTREERWREKKTNVRHGNDAAVHSMTTNSIMSRLALLQMK